MFILRLLAGTSPFTLLAPDDGAGSGAGSGGGSGGADVGAGTAGGDGGAGQGASGSAAGAAGGAGGDGAGGAAGGSGSTTGGDQGSLGAGAGKPIAAGGDGAGAATPPSPATWPDDWRERLAGDDTGFLNTLKRYASPNDLGNWVRGQQLKMSRGELRAPPAALPENATDEQKAAWRAEQGLPAKPEDYVTNLKLPDGLVAGEADKPILEAVAKMAHGANYSQKTVDDFVGFYFDLQNRMVGERVQRDEDYRLDGERQLLQAMGRADFTRNMLAMESFWAEQPAGVADVVLGARTEDGRLIGNIPEVASWIAQLARELNPAAALLPPGTDGSPQSIATRKAEIEGQMYVDGKQNPAYFGGALEKEYRELIQAEQRAKSRAG